ncbi:hypothetical protein TVAG_429740 [Trichomonas vaginalis G3]|uniref:Uncharacterized protein n=1 Tax=Trichomonas vaginalis (strain ATCC PRA-98 / G3) TaxID=412133 RepID=A2FKN4_TRIV3|nr:hypothetical protein TVAGG3_0403230 [Trichomonas vaginalis G3]EAX94532.1 hypothetical protein TVAG_429740 [Trichomonas vaginalis G3]KAI5534848.1 hypothetical protein TVAGG3_0403230 [Trichomonas vaginalis G3]|eukprot:XP_001307462.1 hypothetical protein [Trichomonas vaginalis G3]
MPVSSPELIGAISNAITSTECTAPSVTVQYTAYSLGASIIKPMVVQMKWDKPILELNSQILSEMVLNYAIVYGIPTVKNHPDKIVQYITSGAAVTLYFKLLARLLEDIDVVINDTNLILYEFFQKKIPSDVIFNGLKNIREYADNMSEICQYADMEIAILPSEFQITQTFDRFKAVIDNINTLCKLIETIINTYLRNPQQVVNYQVQYEKLHEITSTNVPVFTRLFSYLADQASSQYTPVFEENEFNSFCNYLKSLNDIVSKVVLVTFKITKYNPPSFPAIQQILDQLLVRFSIITIKMTSLMRFRGDYNDDIEEVEKAYKEIGQTIKSLYDSLTQTLATIPAPSSVLIGKRLNETFETLAQLLSPLTQKLNSVEESIHSDPRSSVFQFHSKSFETELVRKAHPFIKAQILLTWNLFNYQIPIEQVITECYNVESFFQSFNEAISKFISESNNTHLQKRYGRQRANIFYEYTQFVQSLYNLQQDIKSTSVRSFVAMCSIKLIFALCSLDNDQVIEDALDALRKGLAVKNAMIYSEEKNTVVKLLETVSVYVNPADKLAQTILAISIKMIIESADKIPQDIQPEDYEKVTHVLDQNYNIGLAMSAIQTSIPKTSQTQSLLSQLDIYSQIFMKFSHGYRVAIMMQTAHEGETLMRAMTQMLTSLNNTGEKTKALRESASDCVASLKNVLSKPPPYGVFYRNYMTDMFKLITSAYKEVTQMTWEFEQIFVDSNDSANIRNSIMTCNKCVENVIKTMPFVHRLFHENRLEVPALSGVIAKDSIEKCIQQIKHLQSDPVQNYVSAFNTVIKLIETSYDIGTFTGFKNIANSLKQNAELLDSVATRIALSGGTVNEDIKLALKGVEEAQKRLIPICEALEFELVSMQK